MFALRPAARADLPILDTWFDDAETQRWLGGRDWPAQALRLAAADLERHAFVVVLRGEPVGLLDVEVYADGTASFANVVAPSRRRQGIATQALRELFDAPELSAVVTWFAGVEDGNEASRQLLGSLGFRASPGPGSEGFVRHELPAVVAHARGLLGRSMTAHGVTARITEVEAYGGIDDPASHAYTRTGRSEIMYGPPWHLYVYRSMGIHWCANVVTGPRERAAAVLIRAGEVVDGLDLARERRGPAVTERALARGPGNFARSLGITGTDRGTPVLRDGTVRLGGRVRLGRDIISGPRVGISRAADVPWRFWIAGDPTVSAYRRSPRADQQIR